MKTKVHTLSLALFLSLSNKHTHSENKGAHQLEVVVLLMAMKCLYPSRVFLVRGNHEFRDVRCGERVGERERE